MNTRSPPNPVRDMLVFLYTMGFLFTAIAAYFALDTWRFVDEALHAEGVVVAVKSGTFWQTWPIVFFETERGARVKFQSNVPSRNSPRFPIGTRVDVLYDPHEPSNARINSFIDMWGLAWGSGIMGFVFLALGTVALLKAPGRAPPAPAQPDG